MQDATSIHLVQDVRPHNLSPQKVPHNSLCLYSATGRTVLPTYRRAVLLAILAGFDSSSTLALEARLSQCCASLAVSTASGADCTRTTGTTPRTCVCGPTRPHAPRTVYVALNNTHTTMSRTESRRASLYECHTPAADLAASLNFYPENGRERLNAK